MVMRPLPVSSCKRSMYTESSPTWFTKAFATSDGSDHDPSPGWPRLCSAQGTSRDPA